MAEYWRKNPPVHLLVAAYMGWKAPETASEASNGGAARVASPENEKAAGELMAALAFGG